MYVVLQGQPIQKVYYCEGCPALLRPEIGTWMKYKFVCYVGGLHNYYLHQQFNVIKYHPVIL